MFGTQRLAIIGVIMFAIGCASVAGGSMRYFGWTLVLPLIAAYAIFRVRTVVDGQGVTARSLFRTRRAAWDDVRGVRVPPRGPVRVVAVDTEFPLPSVYPADLARLAAVSGGRLPDLS